MNLSHLQPNVSVLSIADQLCELALLAYQPFEPAPLGWTYDRVREIGEVRYRILANADCGILAVAGSDAARDFINWNSDTAIRTYGGYRLHKGFAGYAQTIISDLAGVPDLPEVFGRGDWYSTGHSLGAAAAGIIPYLLDVSPVSQLELPSGVCGFGVPNFCIGATSAKYPVQNAAFISSRWDVVARLPGGTFFRKYCKPNDHFWIDDRGLSTWDGNQLSRVAWYVGSLVLLALRKIAWNNSGAGLLKEHSLLTYLTRIQTAMKTLEADTYE